MNWFQKRRSEFFYRRAKEQKYRARSAYKLLEIQKKFRIIKRGDKVLDLGAAPGSWSQIALALGADVVAVDKLAVAPLKGKFRFIQLDLESKNAKKKLMQFGPFDVVLSDMAPEFIGVRQIDIGRALKISRLAFDIALTVLKKGGHFVCKCFDHPEIKNLVAELKQNFKLVKIFKPHASLRSSSEIYLVCKDLRKFFK